MRIIYATFNPGKMDEVQSVGRSYGIDVVSLADVGVQLTFNESGATFKENAQLKLEQALAALNSNTQDWVVADDSGLSINALGGEPGVNTRRWTGNDMSDEQIIAYTLDRLKDIPNESRTAHLEVVAALGKNGTQPLSFAAEVTGSILRIADSGTPPMPHQPFNQLFFVSEAGVTLGLLNSDQALQKIATPRQRAFERVFRYLNDLQSLTGHFE